MDLDTDYFITRPQVKTKMSFSTMDFVDMPSTHSSKRSKDINGL